MEISSGGYINITNPDDMYGISQRDFEDTYIFVDALEKQDQNYNNIDKHLLVFLYVLRFYINKNYFDLITLSFSDSDDLYSSILLFHCDLFAANSLLPS